MSASGVYSIINRANGKRYVGSAVHFPDRKRQHLRALTKGAHHSIKLQRAWAKHGESNFAFELLLRCDKQDLIYYEQRAIDAFNSVSEGYNVAPIAGSTLGMIVRAETCAKLSAVHKGRKKTAEHQAKIAAANTGKKRSPDVVAKMREASKGNKNCAGRKISEETRKRLSESHKGRTPSDETRKRISDALRGRRRIFTPEHRANLAKALQARKLKKSLTKI